MLSHCEIKTNFTVNKHGDQVTLFPSLCIVDFVFITDVMLIVDGVWNEWSDWTHCQVTCGGAKRHRNRECYGPFHGGNECIGSEIQTEVCNDNPCPGKRDREINYESHFAGITLQL